MTSATINEEMRDMFVGNFMDATDILGTGKPFITLVISDVVGPNKEEDSKRKKIDKAIISFTGAKKRLILNKTNCKLIAMLHGDKAQEWVGKPVRLCVRYLEKAFGQFNVPVIRVMPADDKPMTFGMRAKYGSETPFVKQQ